MKIGVVQTNTGRDADENIAQLETLLAKVADAELVLTPEATNIMGYNPNDDVLPELENDPVFRYLRGYARKAEQTVVIGSLLVSDGRPVNRQVMIGRSGEIIATYDKIHMFDVALPNGEAYRESDRFQAGSDLVVTPFADTVIGHSICFDLRFGEQFRALAQMGAGVILAPAAFTKVTGEAHWETLLRARAIENGAFVIAAAQTGAYTHHDGSTRETWGRSMIVDPWGRVLLEMGEQPDAAVVDIDIGMIAAVRAQIPVLEIAKAHPL